MRPSTERGLERDRSRRDHLVIPAKDILERTVLLARDQVPPSVPDPEIVEAFTQTRVGIRLSTAVLESTGGVTALETLRVLLAGLCLPMRLEITGRDRATRLRPPFSSGHWLEALHQYRSQASAPLETGPLGDSCLVQLSLGVEHPRSLYLAADDKDSYLGRGAIGRSWAAASPWTGARTAVLAVAESYKAVLRQLTAGSPLAEGPAAELAALAACRVPLPYGANHFEVPRVTDFVSAGAINNCALLMLMRMDVAINGRIWDAESVDASNFNRYPLLDVESLGQPKVDATAGIGSRHFSLVPWRQRFDSTAADADGAIVVGADRVDARWEAARRRPELAIIGATDHFLTMDSSHRPTSLGCPGCIHPVDDGVFGDVPTVSFVAMAAGMGVAARWCGRLEVGGYTLIPSWLRMDSKVAQIVDAVPRNPRCPISGAHEG